MQQLFGGIYRGRRVLITGHTGFKGSWLTLWLRMMGAEVTGFSIGIPTQPSLFEAAGVGEGIADIRGDVRNLAAITAAMEEACPEIVFHMAAQPIVRASYDSPVETFATNVMGTVNVLESVRNLNGRCCVVNVTSDKCYENHEWVYAYRENDPMGGHAPYNASKGCAELAAAAYRRSFFQPERFDEHHKAMASVRAGNVIGGGDWAADRLVPDCARCVAAGQPVPVRNPESVRPWQHVLEPLSGYLQLGQALWEHPADIDGRWNFGPDAMDNLSVQQVVQRLLAAMQIGEWEDVSAGQVGSPHEDRALRLDCSKAIAELHWRPVWKIDRALQATAQWYRGYYTEDGFNARACCQEQIRQYLVDAAGLGVPWTSGK